MSLSTEYPFTLPIGYIDGEGNRYQNGVMRLATAADEILSAKDMRVQSNPAYLVVIILSKVITELGTLPKEEITPKLMEKLFVSDFSYLRGFYEEINRNGKGKIPATCPKCDNKFEVSLGSSD
jgi:hypothetical protein